MKIVAKSDRQTFVVDIQREGENKMICPKCSHTRKKSKDKCLSINSKGFGRCNHCDETFYEYVEEEIKQYKKPEFKNTTALTDKSLKWFQDTRMIGQKVLNDMQIKSNTIQMGSKSIPSIALPYFRRGELINIKSLGYYREEGQTKRTMRLEKDAELIWYNYDAILEFDEIIIVEGEIDVLSFLSDGVKNVVSVPNGAGASNLTYIDNSIKDLEGKSFIIAVDNDEAGRKLQRELVRRLGEENCKLLDFKDCKDANEFHVKNLGTGLKEILKNAKQIKPEGIELVDDFFDDFFDDYYNYVSKGVTIGCGLDNYMKLETGRLLVITGTPGSGKSNFTHWINCKLNTLYDWKIGYWSSEMSNKNLLSVISHMVTGETKRLEKSKLKFMKQYLNNNYFFIDANSVTTIDDILAKFKYFVKAYGVKVVNIDPFTNIERSNENDYTYIRETLNKLTRFAKKYDVLVQLVAHPRKLNKRDDGTFPIPSMYDISGSADFWNKCDYGLAVCRAFNPATDTYGTDGVIQIHKVKTTELGSAGRYDYNYEGYRYYDMGKIRDSSNWIETEPKQQEIIEEIDFSTWQHTGEEPF